MRHEYRFDGALVPSVTGIISPLTKLWGTGAQLARAREEGRAIHKLVELECKDQLDSVPYWLGPYLRAWLSFKEHSGFRLVASEFIGYESALRYAGTLDLDGVLTKFKGSPAALIDIKRSLAGAPAIGVQLAGYHGLVSGPRLRFGLQLKDNGTYRLAEYKDPGDRAVFLSCLSILRWRERNQ